MKNIKIIKRFVAVAAALIMTIVSLLSVGAVNAKADENVTMTKEEIEAWAATKTEEEIKEALDQYYQALAAMGQSALESAVTSAASSQTTGNTTSSSSSTSLLAATGSASSAVQNYFAKSVFIGDSVMVGFKNYSQSHATSAAANAQYLCNVSYSAYNALKGSKHPAYNGVSRKVWENVALMDVDRVFIFLGINDLIWRTPDALLTDIDTIASNIKSSKPGVEINLISIPPVYTGTNKGYLNTTGIDLYNSKLSEFCSKKGYSYIDINSYLKGTDGSIKPEYSGDKYVHETSAAYAIWDSVLTGFANTKVK